MKKCFFASALFVSLGCFASQSPVNLEGKYDCAGNEVGTNEAFKCEMIIKQTGETYASTASCSDGNSYAGNGIYDKNTHSLSTGFINPKKREETGVSVSAIKADGKIVSVWTYLNNTSIGHTTCIKHILDK